MIPKYNEVGGELKLVLDDGSSNPNAVKIAVLLPKHEEPLPPDIMRALLHTKRIIESTSNGEFVVDIWKDEEAYEQHKNPAFNHPAFTTQAAQPPLVTGWKS